jgi:hypothetical protein
MGYTTVANVAGMFPNFVRGTAAQKPSDTLIQTYIDDVAAEINAILVRRGFVAAGLTPAQIQTQLSADAVNVCEMINRYGAAAQLGETLGTLGVAAAREFAKNQLQNYQTLKRDLDARAADGRPLASGTYDKYFDPQARTETAKPGLKAVAGGDQPENETPGITGGSQCLASSIAAALSWADHSGCQLAGKSAAKRDSQRCLHLLTIRPSASLC